MARINIEDEFWMDPRVLALAEKYGRYAAYGMCLELFRLGFSYYEDDRKPIPLAIFRVSALPEEIEKFGFIEFDPAGDVFVSESEKHFGWIFEYREKGSKGGKQKAENAKKRAMAELKPDSSPAIAQVQPGYSPALAELYLGSSPAYPPTPTPTPTPTHNNTPSSFSLNSNTVDVRPPLPPTAPGKNEVQDFENRMNGVEDRWRKVFEKMYEPERPDSMLMRNIPKIIRNYSGNFEAFKAEMEDIWNGSSDKKTGRAYMTVAIKKQTGLLPPPEVIQ